MSPTELRFFLTVFLLCNPPISIDLFFPSQLLNSKIQAFIWDSAMLDYEAARDCSLMTVGELFGRSGFGIGLRKDSPWTSKISLQILNFHESGIMESFDSIWIRQKICIRTNNQPKTLGMANMGGKPTRIMLT